MIRPIKKIIKGTPTIDGAGVSLTRVLGHHTIKEFDPFLMLDSFDSKNPEDYTNGFPMHPHRGIETVTYLIKGDIEHQDSLGNSGSIKDGESQWMNAGSGILHQERPQAVEHMLGFQLWVNLPQKDKMSDPTYRDITNKDGNEVKEDGVIIRIIAGEYGNTKASRSKFVDTYIFDIQLDDNKKVAIPTRSSDTVFVFVIEGNIKINDKEITKKSAVLFDEGAVVEITGGENSRVIYFAGKPLNEQVAWGGPIVMNTDEELQVAFQELNTGRFIKHNAINRRN